MRSRLAKWPSIADTPRSGDRGYRRAAPWDVALSPAWQLLGFTKNERDNIGPEDLADLRLLANGWFESAATMARDLETFIEVKP